MLKTVSLIQKSKLTTEELAKDYSVISTSEFKAIAKEKGMILKISDFLKKLSDNEINIQDYFIRAVEEKAISPSTNYHDFTKADMTMIRNLGWTDAEDVYGLVNLETEHQVIQVAKYTGNIYNLTYYDKQHNILQSNLYNGLDELREDLKALAEDGPKVKCYEDVNDVE